MRKFVCAAVLTVCTVGIAIAEDIQAIVYKIDGGKVTYKKTEKGKATGDELTATLTKDAKIIKGKASFDKETKKVTVETVGEALDKDAVTAMMTKAVESKAKGARAQLTTDGSGNVTQVILIGGKGKKKKDAN